MLPYIDLGLTNSIDPPFILGRSWKNTKGDFFVAPIPDILRGSGIHYSAHGRNHLHLKSDREELNIHEDVDLQSFLKNVRTADQRMIRAPAEGQSGSIFIVNMNDCLNRIASTTSQRIKGKNIQNILLNTEVLSQFTIQIDINNMKMIPETMNWLRLNRFARPGDFAMFYGHQTNEISLYAYPPIISKYPKNFLFTTIELDSIEQPDMNAIKRVLPFAEPLFDPTIEALRKASSYLFASSYIPKDPSLNPSYYFTL
jgi:hypothetical protein